MKHLSRIFEERLDSITVTTVVFSGGDDDVLACYVDGDLEFHGDYYNDRIGGKIDGFITGLKWIKENYVYPLKVDTEWVKCNDDEMAMSICEGEDPPEKLSDVGHESH